MAKNTGDDLQLSCNRDIPQPMQREVRKRCGFGCVVCGLPLYEYHHIKEWAAVHEHTAENLTLLCDRHHREVHSKLLPETMLVEANKSPFNIQEGASSPYALHYEGHSVECTIGDNTFVFPKDDPHKRVRIAPLVIHGKPIIAFDSEDSHLLLNLVLYDSSNELVLEIENNNLRYSVSPWDIEFTKRTLTVREKSRSLMVSMTFAPPNAITVDAGKVVYNGVEVAITKKEVVVAGNTGVRLTLGGNRCDNIQADVAVGILVGNLPEEYSNLNAAVGFWAGG